MSAELERRLERALGRLPHASRDVEERARAAALATLPGPPRRSRRRPVAIAAVLGAVLVAVTASLAATGTVHIGARPRAVAPPQLRLPPRVDGILVLVDGRLWLTTRGGARIEGFRASAAALSPHALFVAAGIGRSLVAMAPNGRTAWLRKARGDVVAISWAPDGLRIAYVVRTPRAFVLRTVEGDGDHDRLLDAHVRPVRPSWRADSLALAYVGAGGRVVVYDFGHRSHAPVRAGCTAGATHLAFAPAGTTLAAATAGSLAVIDRSHVRCTRYRGRPVALAWSHGHPALAIAGAGTTALAGDAAGVLAALRGRGATRFVWSGGGSTLDVWRASAAARVRVLDVR